MRDMLPYGKLPELASVMTAHVAYHAFEGEVATFSRRLLQDELRERLGFRGLVFSDDLSMKGAAGGSVTEQAEKALAARLAGLAPAAACGGAELEEARSLLAA